MPPERPSQSPPPEPQDEADFNRPFEMESQIPPDEDNDQMPGTENGRDAEEDLDALLILKVP